MLSKARSSPRLADHTIKHLGLDNVDGISLMSILQLDQQVVPDAKKDESKLTEWLWNQTKEYHQLALDTPFIQGMKTGTLNPILFGIYNLQDAVYCYNSITCLNLVAKKSTGDMKTFAENKEKTYKEYTDILFKKWHVLDPPTSVEMGGWEGPYVLLINNVKCKFGRGYSKHELSVAESMDPIYSFIAMIPCSRLWPWLGQQLKDFRDLFGVYKEWIDDNLAGNGYRLLEKFVEDHSATVDKQKALDVYKKSMKCEYEFFNSAQ
eukprot:gene12374-13647_t